VHIIAPFTVVTLYSLRRERGETQERSLSTLKAVVEGSRGRCAFHSVPSPASRGRRRVSLSL